jgi:two-component system NtrC family sensor kinase
MTDLGQTAAELEAKLRSIARERDAALEQQAATAGILKVIASSRGDAQPVFDQILQSIEHLFGGEDRAIFLTSEDGLLHIGAAFGPNADRARALYPIPLKGSASELAIRERRLVRSADVLNDADVPSNLRDFAKRFGKNYSMVIAPMLSEERAIGSIFVARTSMIAFSDSECSLLRNFADQAVIAIENARLFDELQARTRDLTEALTYQTGSANILKVIASSPTDVEPTLKAIVESVCELCEAYDAGLLMKDGEFLRFSAHHGPIPIGLEKWPINRRWTAGRAFIDQTPIHIEDLRDEKYADFSDGRELSIRMGHLSILSVPLLREKESIGAIVLRRKEVHPFTEKQITLLQTFADQAVIAIGNVHLFEEVRAKTRDLTESLQQQTATSEVLQTISNSSGDLQPVFDAMLANATHICNAKFGMMWLIEGPAARCVALHNAPPAFAELRRREPVIRPGPNTAMGRLLKTKQIVHVEDAMAERAYIEGDPVRRANADLAGARTILAVPMLKENQVIGAIGIFHQEVRPFNEKQIGLVTNFANQAVIAIENARLLNQLRERTTELSQSLDELRTAQDRLVQTEKLASLGQLTAGIAHEIKNPLNFVNNFSELSTELIDEVTDILKVIALDQKPREELEELTQLLKSNLEKVVQHGKRADAIVKNMLLHSREGSGEYRSADINALVEESLNLAYHGARAGKSGFNITLQRDVDPGAGEVMLYPQEMTRALLNLVANGFYAAAKRKSDAGDQTFEPVLSAATRNLGNRVEIRIRDNGTGIPPEVREKMFDPFFTTKPAGEGTGLGLSMTHDIIVKQHDGRIDVETEPGVFTEFIITLPRTAPARLRTEGRDDR